MRLSTRPLTTDHTGISREKWHREGGVVRLWSLLLGHHDKADSHVSGVANCRELTMDGAVKVVVTFVDEPTILVLKMNPP